MKETQLQRNVLAELDWDPMVNAAEVGVTVDDGIITLTGTVKNFADKYAAERAVKRVTGVKAVANDLQVKLPSSGRRSDTDLAKSVVQVLDWDIRIPANRVKPTIKDGWVTLEGEVDWNFERESAAKVIRRLKGVLGLTNLITVKPRVHLDVVKAKIDEALTRSAKLDASQIRVKVEGSKVTLTGSVRSWPEREDAEHAAWAAPGVTRVDNDIRVEHMVYAGVAD